MASVQADSTETFVNDTSFQEFTKIILKSVVSTIQNGNSFLPLLEEFEYWSSFSEFSEYCSESGSRILNNIGELLRHHAIQCGWVSAPMQGINSIDLEERFDRLVDSNDILLENVGTLIDEASGIKKNEKPLVPINMKQSVPIVSSWNRKQKQMEGNQSAYKLLLAKNIQRPQLKWTNKIDNSNTPFFPYLRNKPNALKPLEEDTEEDTQSDSVESFIRETRIGSENYKIIRHPYEYEISEFEPNDQLLERKDPIMYWPLEEKPVTIVVNEEEFNKMFEHLKSVKEIAIDLEHHSYRSFQGFVCLMQISTRAEDFIVDTLQIRDELHILNEVFTDPNILKVLHGADMDIGWLMRDFGLYIVNMFDTGQAARTLQEDRFSLAFLLKKHCNVDAQKQYQLADWRIRPLPEEMISYAREDTHYLLYIYDCMRNTLIDRGNETNNLLRSVYSKSSIICQTVYEKQRFYSDSYMIVYDKYRGRLNDQQLECFRLLYEWRDKISREEDESYGYTLPNHMMFRIAENLPREPPGVIACCNPVPPLVKQHLLDIHRLVLIARIYDPVESQSSNITANTMKDETSTGRTGTAYLDNSKSGFELYQVTEPLIKRRTPSLTVFNVVMEDRLCPGIKKAKEILKMLSSPFQQYLPNTGIQLTQPEKINESWKQKSKKVTKEKETNRQDQKSEVSRDQPQKRKIEEPTNSLRELLPKKKSKNECDKSKINEGNTNTSEFVPFDYSKADYSKFAGKKDAEKKIKTTEEPRKGKVTKTKVQNKAGGRSMTFK